MQSPSPLPALQVGMPKYGQKTSTTTSSSTVVRSPSPTTTRAGGVTRAKKIGGKFPLPFSAF